MVKQGIQRLTREDWLNRALEALEARGERGLSVSELARTLGVSRGSFYWHFHDRADLVQSVLDYWKDRLTVALRETSRQAESPKEIVQETVRLVVETDAARFDIPIRAWAARDPSVAEVVREVDRIRLEWFNENLRKIGFRGRDLEARARLVLYSLMAEAEMSDHGEAPRDAKMQQRMLEIILLPC